MLGKGLIVTVAILFAQAGKPEKEQKPAAPPASGVKEGTPAVDTAGANLALTGITFTIPRVWKAQDPGSGPMTAKAVYSIPAAKPGEDEGVVRITHYPEMKGKDDMNIDRWIGQVAKADGKPSTRADAKIEKTESGNIRITTVDLSGNVKITMKDSGKTNQRMIAAIVDHPKGPHFVVAAGPVESMKTWGNDILGFIKSAKVTEP